MSVEHLTALEIEERLHHAESVGLNRGPIGRWHLTVRRPAAGGKQYSVTRHRRATGAVVTLTAASIPEIASLIHTFEAGVVLTKSLA